MSIIDLQNAADSFVGVPGSDGRQVATSQRDGGLFRWDASDLSTEVTADEVSANQGDGGVYVAPTSDKSGASGALVRVGAAGIFNVRWYGALGDGATDDSVAIQAAVNAATAFPYGTILFPDCGTYRINSQIDLGDGGSLVLQGQAHRGVNGGAAGTEILSYVDDDAIITRSLGRTRIENLAITDGLGVSRTQGAGVRAVRSDSGNVVVTCKNVKVRAHYYGFHVSRGVLCQFEACTADTCTSHGFLLESISGNGASTSPTLSSCFAISCNGAGYYFDGGQYCALVGCAADNNGDGYVIAADSGYNPNTMSFQGCGAENNGDTSFKIASSAGSGATSISYVGCQSFNAGATGWDPHAGQGVVLVACKTVTSGTQGIDLTNSTQGDVVVIGHTYSSDVANVTDPNNVLTQIDGAQGMIPGSIYRHRAAGNLPTGAVPDISGEGDRGNVYLTANGGNTSLTNIAGGLEGYPVTLVGADGGNTTIVGGGGLTVHGGRFKLEDEHSITLLHTNGKWHETSRSPSHGSPAKISPTALTGTVQDWDAGQDNATTSIIVTTDAVAPYTIGGLDATGIEDGSQIWLVNATNMSLTLSHEGGSSSSTNRFHMVGTVDRVLAFREGVLLLRDTALNRWRVLA